MLRCRPSTPSEAGRSTALSFVAPRKADPRCLRQLADAMLGCPQFRSTRFHCAARETEFCRQRLAGDIGRRPRGERSEFGSQTVARLANRPELRGFLSSGKRGRFARTGWWAMQGSNLRPLPCEGAIWPARGKRDLYQAGAAPVPARSFVFMWTGNAGAAKLHLGAYEEAATWIGQSVAAYPHLAITRFFHAAALGQLGRIAETRVEAEGGLALNPGFTIKRFREHPDCDNPIYLEERRNIYEGLRKASGFRSFAAALGFFTEWPDPARAAQLVLARASEIDGNLYYLLDPTARLIEGKHPLAATLLRRAMIEDTLDGAKSTRYKHAARHLLECRSLAASIRDFGEFETHEAFVSRLRA